MIKSAWVDDPDLITYALRNPLLFGDFRNACNEGEVRLYEDLLDYEAIFNLFMEVISYHSLKEFFISVNL